MIRVYEGVKFVMSIEIKLNKKQTNKRKRSYLKDVSVFLLFTNTSGIVTYFCQYPYLKSKVEKLMPYKQWMPLFRCSE